MSRRLFVCGNWKLHKNLAEARSFVDALKHVLLSSSHVEVAVAPVATLLFPVGEKTRGTSIGLAAQNVYFEAKGAFTGEWSVEHVLEAGCQYAIVGHSERRQYFADSDESVAKKTLACLKGRVTPIVCVGESLSERQNGTKESVLGRQLGAVMELLNGDDMAHAVLAYEPIWAIGTGQTATSIEAEEAHAFLRRQMSAKFGESVAQKVRILYGGSVKPENTRELLLQPNIDGALVGGASLQLDSFLAIVQVAQVAAGS